MAEDRAGGLDEPADVAAKIDTTVAHPAGPGDPVPEDGMSAHGGVGRKP